MSELRWILLGLGLLLIAGIWWRGTRKPSQASDKAELRDNSAGGKYATAQVAAPAAEALMTAGALSERSASVLEPLSIKTADFEDVPELGMPMTAESAALPPAPPAEASDSPVQALPPAEMAAPGGDHSPAEHGARPRTDNSGRFAPLATPRVNASELQKIVTLRVCALGDGRWSGRQLIDALELQGLAYGRYQVFHRNHVDGRSLFCVASLVEPGTFDLPQMLTQEFRGITAFAVLPGPLEPLQAIESLIATTRRLAESLTGMVQDGNGVPLSPQRAAVLRDEVARFQALLP